MEEILGIVLIVLLVLFLLFLLLRQYICWYFKINARLYEQRKTNELLQNIFDALVQGNAIGSIQVGSVESLKAQMAKGGKKMEAAFAANQNTAQIPQPGDVDNSLPPL